MCGDGGESQTPRHHLIMLAMEYLLVSPLGMDPIASPDCSLIEAYRKAEAGYLAHVRSAEYSHPLLGELRRASEQSNRVLSTKDHLRIGLARILRRAIGRWRLAGSWRLHEAYRRLTYFSASE